VRSVHAHRVPGVEGRSSRGGVVTTASDGVRVHRKVHRAGGAFVRLSD
jgi:hypothetical protein